jgi:transcriptional activator
MRYLRAVAAAVVLAGLVVGVPIVLALFGRLPSSSELAAIPTKALSDTTAFAVLTLAAWAAWLAFVVSLVVEAAAKLELAPRRRMPYVAPLQLGVRKLLGALSMTAGLAGPLASRAVVIPMLPATASVAIDFEESEPDFDGSQPVAQQIAKNHAVPDEERHGVPVARIDAVVGALRIAGRSSATPPSSPSPRSDLPSVVVRPGDSPWELASRHLGSGLRWRELWELNRNVPQSDGSAWTVEDLILVGWRLQLPDDAVEVQPVVPGAIASDVDEEDGESSTTECRTTPAPDDREAQPTASSPSATPSEQGDEDPPTTRPDDSQTSANGRRPSVDDRQPTGSTGSTADSQSQRSTGDPNESSTPAHPIVGITGAVVVATGLGLHLRRRRRLMRARAASAGRLPTDRRARETEHAIAVASDAPLVHWAAPELSAVTTSLRPGRVLAAPVAVEVSEEAGIEILWEQPWPDAPRPWKAADRGWAWRLPYDPDAPLPPNDQPAAMPALVTVGNREGRQLLLNLEAYGSLAITGDAEAVAAAVRAIVLELGTGELLTDSYVDLALEDVDLVHDLSRVTPMTSEEAARHIQTTAAAVEDALTAAGMTSSFEYRLGGQSHIETVVAIVEPGSGFQLPADRCRPHRGVAMVVVGGGESEAAAHLRIDADGTAHLEPLGLTFQAAGIPPDTSARLSELLTAEDHPNRDPADDGLPNTGGTNGSEPHPNKSTHEPFFQTTDAQLPISPARAAGSNGHQELGDEPPDDWTHPKPRLLVKVLGAPRIPERPQLSHRQLALAVYLSCRDGAPVKNSTVQDALWGGKAIEAKTLWNVIGRTRTALGELAPGEPVMPPADRTSSTLRIADGVTTDLAILRQLYERSLVVASSEAIDLLRQGLDFVEGPPFDAPGYEWAHHMTQYVADASALIERATEHLVDLALDAGMTDVAREAIIQGLRGLPGNEVLYRSRMRLEHTTGNLAAVRAAYDELVMFLDDLDSEPTENTVTLYRRFIGGTAAA